MLDIDDSEKDNFFKKPARTTILKDYFDDLILARKNVPINYNFDIENLFGFNNELLNFAKKYQEFESDFDKHARASIPFSYEESIILYYTILKFLSDRNGGNILSIDAANGSLERVITKLSNGKINSLFTTANKANIEIYNKKSEKNCIAVECASKDILFYLKNDIELNKKFNRGFDVFLELVGFQMYGIERELPIKYFKQVLNRNGIAIFFEKNTHEDKTEFLKRSRMKNELFKTRFFNKKDIKEKEEEILSVMDKNLVTLEELKKSILNNYNYISHIWNSVNFNIIIASDDEESLREFIRLMPKSIIDEKFIFEDGLLKVTGRK